MEFGDHHGGMHDMHHHDHAAMMATSHTGVLDGSSPTHFLCQSDMGMVMYMDGFRWTLKGDGTCLNFLFESWKFDTVLKFAVAMACVVAMGIATEGINRWKHNVFEKSRRLHPRRDPRNGSRLRVLQTFLQGLSILSAYVLMLVVMTYSLELLFCVILGLMIGYYIFDGDAINHNGGTPCCNFLEGGGSDDTETRTSSLTEALLPRTTALGGIGGGGGDNTNSRAGTTASDMQGTTGSSCCNDHGAVSLSEEEGI